MLSIGGFAAVLLGCMLGPREIGPGWLYGALAVAGFAVLIGGLVIGYRFLVCPHCGGPLYDSIRLPSELPTYCPHCGKKLEETHETV